MRAPGSSGLAYTHTYLVAVLFSTTPLVIQTCCTGRGGIAATGYRASWPFVHL